MSDSRYISKKDLTGSRFSSQLEHITFEQTKHVCLSALSSYAHYVMEKQCLHAKAPQGVSTGSMLCSLQSLLILTINLGSGENSRYHQGSEGAHLLRGRHVFREHNQEVANLRSITFPVHGDSNPHPTASSLALVWLGLVSC